LGFFDKLKVPLEEGESRLEAPSSPFQISNLSLRGVLADAVKSNPDVILDKKRVEAARGLVRTRLGDNVSIDNA
jgi:hypothetical protein